MSKIGPIAQSDTAIITDGLVFNMDFSKFACYPRTGTTVTDLKGSQNGSVDNSPSFTTNNLGVFDFDGVDQKIDCGKPSVLDTFPLSIEVWFNADSTNTKSDGIITKGTTRGASYQRDWDITGNGTNLTWVVSTGGSYAFIVSTTYPSLNTWHQVVCTWDGTTIPNTARINLDGAFAAQGSASSTSYVALQDVFIGGNRTNYFFDGKIAVARFYNRVLTSDEIAINYNAIKERFGL